MLSKLNSAFVKSGYVRNRARRTKNKVLMTKHKPLSTNYKAPQRSVDEVPALCYRS